MRNTAKNDDLKSSASLRVEKSRLIEYRSVRSRFLQKQLAGGAVLQVDRATRSHQALPGASRSVGKSQVWIAIDTYVLVVIIRKRLDLVLSLHAMILILSVTLFEKVLVIQLLTDIALGEENPDTDNQLMLL